MNPICPLEGKFIVTLDNNKEWVERGDVECAALWVLYEFGKMERFQEFHKEDFKRLAGLMAKGFQIRTKEVKE